MTKLLKLLALSSSLITGIALSAPATVDYCPNPKDLYKIDLYWYAPGGWVSYGESFERHVVKFVRAEWKGINVGKIICIYRGDKPIAFPIALEQKQTKLVPSPMGAQWSKDLGGRKECLAVNNKVHDCPFIFEKPAEVEDVYKEIDFYKGKSQEF